MDFNEYKSKVLLDRPDVKKKYETLSAQYALIQAEFSEQILTDLLEQGLTDQELLERFKVEQDKVRPAVERMIAEADQIAKSS